MNLEVSLKKHSITKAPRSFIEALQHDVRSGAYKPGDSLGCEYDLAKRYNVSRTTVRTAIELLKKENVVRAVPRCGVFLCDEKPVIHSEALFRSYTLIRYCDDTLQQEICAGMLDYFQQNHLNLNIVDVNLNIDRYADIINHVPDNGAIAMIPFETQEIMTAISKAIDRGVRIVQLDRPYDCFETPGVQFDNFAGGFMATTHLLQEHCEPVWYLGYDSPSSVAKRLAGWRTAMTNFGFFDYEKYIIPGIKTGKWNETHPRESFDRRPKEIAKFLRQRIGMKTVIFAVNDHQAKFVYIAAESLNMEVGKDIFLTGFDNLAMCTQATPSLTSVDVPRRQMGFEAGKLMSAMEATNCSKILPVELIIRDSSRKI